MAEFVFLAQNWSVDKERFRANLKSLSLYEEQTGSPLCIVLFPEGTLNEPHHILKSKQYAGDNGLPVFDNVLLPRFRGFREMLPILRTKIDYVVDSTCVFSADKPDIFKVLAGEATETALFKTKVYDIKNKNDIPEEDHEVDEWLLDRWREKEEIFEKHYKYKNNDLVDAISDANKVYLELKHVYLKMFIVFSMFIIPFSVLIYDVSLIKHGLTYLLTVCCVISIATLGSFVLTIRPDTNKKKIIKNKNGKATPVIINATKDYGATAQETSQTGVETGEEGVVLEIE